MDSFPHLPKARAPIVLSAITQVWVTHREPWVRGATVPLALLSTLGIAALLGRVSLGAISLGDLWVLCGCLFLLPTLAEAGLLTGLLLLPVRLMAGPDWGGDQLGLWGALALIVPSQVLMLVLPTLWRDRILLERIDNLVARRAAKALFLLPVAGPVHVAVWMLDRGWRPSLRKRVEEEDSRRYGVRGALAWTNWAHSTSCTPTRSYRPSTVDELQAAVRDAVSRGLRIRAVGEGHTWAAFSTTDDALVHCERLGRIQMDLSDPAQPRVVAEVGATNRQLNDVLEKAGFMLPSNVVLEVVRIGGLVATGSHGSGWECSTLSDYVHGVDLVMASGEVRRFETGVDDADTMDALRLSLGAFGVMWRVVLNVVPAWNAHMIDEHLSFDEALRTLPERVNEAYFLDLNFYPGNDVFWVKSVRRTDAPLTGPRARLSTGSMLSGAPKMEAYRGLLALTRAFPRLTPSLGRMVHRFGPHPAEQVLPLPDCIHYERNVEQVRLVNVEIAFKLDPEFASFRKAWEDFVRITAAWNARGEYPLSMVCNIRFLGESTALLGPASGPGHTCWFEVLSGHGTPGWEAYSAELAAAWLQLPGAAPHWAKQWQHLPGIIEHIGVRYADGLPRFRAVREQIDPDRVFGNELLERVLSADLSSNEAEK